MVAKSYIRYVCILRGINVAGVNAVPMEELVGMFEELGYVNLRTHLQNGNVVFDADHAINGNDHVPRIQAALRKKYPFPITVILRRARQLEKTVTDNPFAKGKKVDEDRLYVTFLASHPLSSNMAELNKIDPGKNRFAVVGRDVYIEVHGAYSECRLTNAILEKVLKVQAATRNWRTVRALSELALQKVPG